MFRQPVTRLILLLMVLLLFAPGCKEAAACTKACAPDGGGAGISPFTSTRRPEERYEDRRVPAGVVAAEMDTKWPVNALAAQAILARTFTMENIQEGRVRQLRGTDASTSVEEFQAYEPAKINDNVRKAVEMTR